MAHSFEMVIGITGLKAAGKDAAAALLADRGFTVLRTRDVITMDLANEGLTHPTVAQLQDKGNQGRIESGDLAYWAKRMVKLAEERGVTKLVLNGLRHPGEVQGISAMLGSTFTMIGLVAPTKIRAARFLSREQAGDPREYAAFIATDDRDRGIGEPPGGQQVDRTLALVPYADVYNNSGTMGEFNYWIDDFLKRHQEQP